MPIRKLYPEHIKPGDILLFPEHHRDRKIPVVTITGPHTDGDYHVNLPDPSTRFQRLNARTEAVGRYAHKVPRGGSGIVLKRNVTVLVDWSEAE